MQAEENIEEVVLTEEKYLELKGIIPNLQVKSPSFKMINIDFGKIVKIYNTFILKYNFCSNCNHV
jgi:hypothetical protein